MDRKNKKETATDLSMLWRAHAYRAHTHPDH